MKFVPGVIGKSVSRNALLVQKGSPQILLAAGIVGMGVSTVLACRATLKVEEITDEAKAKLDLARNMEHPDYTEADRQRDVALIYFQSGVKLAKLYGPAVVVGIASIYALATSNRILNARNASLVAAYGALDEGFRRYRERVVEKYGEDVDREFRYGARPHEIKDPVTGKKKIVSRVADGQPSIYARFFDEISPNWNRNHPEYNFIFLHCIQNWANDQLKANGHVFLNEVYDQLGLPRSREGAVVGWVMSGNGETDNFVNFGVFDGSREKVRDFVNGFEGAILLDFNVDGVIYDKI